MKELNDENFDQIFKTRITQAFPEFEEASWLKMEKKLRKRDRLVFYRNASIILLLLSFGMGFYYVNKEITGKEDIIAIKTGSQKNPNSTSSVTIKPPIAQAQLTTEVLEGNLTVAKNNTGQNSTVGSISQKASTDQHPDMTQSFLQQIKNESKTVEKQQLIEATIIDIPQGVIGNSPIAQPIIANVEPEKVENDKTAQQVEKVKKVRRKMPISLAIAAGPDFNSTTAVIGGKTNLAFGVGVSVGLTKKISLQTGINYGHKNYNANANNYTFNNPFTKNTIAAVNAACKVIEIPLRASLNVSENQKRSIEVNAGLSSYLMLKENYVYKYTAASGRSDRLVEATNKNQHLLSVIDLSATYNIKLKNKKLAFGIEPYVKIPLTGIGVGSVPLKSSGISLKLRYDFNKN